MRSPRAVLITNHCAVQEEHPCMLKSFQAFAKAAEGKRVVIFLDYDGKHSSFATVPRFCKLAD